MPAYRSEEEAEVRDAAVAFIRQERPDHRIIHEICARQGGNRFDLLAVGCSEIIAVEVKSARDKIDRLPDQIAAMRGAAHVAISALHEKFFGEALTNEFAAEYTRDGKHYRLNAPDEARRSEVWRYPAVTAREWARKSNAWRLPDFTPQTPLPSTALDMLWRDELERACCRCKVSVPRRSNMMLMKRAILWGASGGAITKAICAELRARDCVEADPPIPTGEN